MIGTFQPLPSPQQVERLHEDVDQLGERIAELSARITAATYKLLCLIREFDERGGWGPGFRSCAHWLNWRTGLAIGAAREKVRVARALSELPRISRAMQRGEVSYSKVRALTRVATSENEEELLLFARSGTASHVERLVRGWRRVDRTEEHRLEKRRNESRYLSAYTDEDGMLVVRGRLSPEAGAVLLKALEAAEHVLYEEAPERKEPGMDAEPLEQRRADALGRLAEAALAGGLSGAGVEGEEGSETSVAVDTRADRYQVFVHVDAAVLADPEAPGQSVVEGQSVPAGTSRRIACDGSRVVMTHDQEGRILDIGRKTRVVSRALRRALTHRDGGCRFPGCDLRFCDAHHIEHWAEGGETKLDNLLLLCRRHHRSVHEDGYRVERAADGTHRFVDPTGRPVPEAPTLPSVRGDGESALVAELDEAGVEIDRTAARPWWEGSAWDLQMTLDALMPIGR